MSLVDWFGSSLAPTGALYAIVVYYRTGQPLSEIFTWPSTSVTPITQVVNGGDDDDDADLRWKKGDNRSEVGNQPKETKTGKKHTWQQSIWRNVKYKNIRDIKSTPVNDQYQNWYKTWNWNICSSWLPLSHPLQPIRQKNRKCSGNIEVRWSEVLFKALEPLDF